MTHASTLSFLRDVETMTIPDAPGVGTGFGKAQEFGQGHGHRAPWNAGVRATPTETPFFLVHLGVLPKRTVVETILTALDPDKPLDTEALDLLSGHASVGCVALDWQGRILADQFLPAPYVFGVRRLREQKSLSNIDEEMNAAVANAIGKLFGQAVEMGDPFAKVQGALDIGAASKPAPKGAAPAPKAKAKGGEDDDEPGSMVFEKPATLDDLLRISKGLLTVAGLTTDNLRVRVVVHTARRKAGKKVKVPDFKEDMLPSFYAKDIDRVLRGGVANSGAALQAYLAAPVPESERVDVLADSRAFAANLTPDALSLARWPTNPNHSLNIAQQAAVGRVRALDEGLVSVNGPPGTGKTTLLRDLVADMVLERAERLARLPHPAQGMTRGTIKPLNDDAEPFEATLVDPRLVEGTGIVVASSNNAAVENISLALPTAESIDEATYPHASYLIGTAQDVFAKTVKPGEKPPRVWGLAALRLGNKENIRTVFKGLARPFVQEGEEAVKAGLFDRLTESGPYDQALWSDLARTFLTRLARVRGLLALRHAHHTEQGNLPVLEAMLEGCRPLDECVHASQPWAKAQTSTTQAQAGVRAAFRAAHPLGATPAWPSVHGPVFHDALRARVQRSKVQVGLLGLCWPAPTAGFFAQSPDVHHRASVWTDALLEQERGELFLDAMRLHEAFLGANVRDIYSYLAGLRKVLTGEIQISDAMALRIWNGVFMLAPVVSTALPSVRKMPTAPGWIGMLLVDEAGQATPQSVIGALARSRKAVILGDPLQIEPVFNVPAPIVERLMEDTGTDARFSPLTASAQTVADGVMATGAWIPRKRRDLDAEWTPAVPDPLALDPLGAFGLGPQPTGTPSSQGPAEGSTEATHKTDGWHETAAQVTRAVWALNAPDAQAPSTPQARVAWPKGVGHGAAPNSGDRVWTGMPMRVHRRCQDPMFSISNAVSYGGQMIQGTPTLPADARINAFGPSAWFDVSGGTHQGKVRTAEMDCLRACLERFRDQPPMLDGTPLSTFVISPFVDVADACRQTVGSVLGWGRGRQCPAGTVHTFQGKEADIVLFVLGTAPGGGGHRARAWAASQANLLNVAITRARLRLYVIGNAEDWRGLPYFADLYASLRQAGRIIPYPKAGG